MGEADGAGGDVDLPADDVTEAPADVIEALADEATTDPTAPRQPDAVDLVAAAFRAALGAVGLAVSAVVSALDRVLREDDEASKQAPAADDGVIGLLRLVPGAALGLGFEIHRRTFEAVRAVAERVAPVTDLVVSAPPVRMFRESATAWLEAWERQGREEQAANSDLAARSIEDAFPRLVDAVLDRIDLNSILARVDLDAVLAGVDMDAVLARVDVDALVARIDVQAVLDRVEIQGIVDRVDIDAVAANIDVEAIVDRLDVATIAQGVLDKLDLTAIAHRVIDEMELGEIIRESTGTVTVEAVDALRVGGMNADRFVARVVDRMLMRRKGRKLEVDSNGSAPPTAGSNGHAPETVAQAEAEAATLAAVEAVAAIETAAVAEAVVEAAAAVQAGIVPGAGPNGAGPDAGADGGAGRDGA